MNRKKVYRFCQYGIGVLLVVLVVYNLQLLEKIEDYLPYAQFYIEKEQDQLTEDTAADLLEQNEESEKQYSFVVWKKEMKGAVQADDLGKEVDTEVYSLQGNSQILFPNVHALDRNDTTSCLISSALASKLFGNLDVKDLTIVYNKRIYVIEAVIAGEEPIFVHEAKKTEDTLFNRITLLGREDMNKALTGQRFSSKMDLNLQLLDYDIFRIILVAVNCLMLFAVLFYLLWKLFKIMKKSLKNRRLSPLIWKSVIQTAVVSILLVLVAGKLHLSSEYLPLELSDFSFMEKLLKEFSENVQLLLQTEKSVGELQQVRYLLSSFLVTILLVVFFLLYCLVGCLARRRRRRRTQWVNQLLVEPIEKKQSSKFMKRNRGA